MPDNRGYPQCASASITYDDGTGFTSTVTTAGTPVTIANAGLGAGDANNTDSLFTVAATSGTITANYTGFALVSFSVSALAGAAGDTISFAVFDASTATDIKVRTTAAATPVLETSSACAVIAVTKGQALSVRHDSNNDSDTATINTFVFGVMECGITSL